MSSGSKAWRHRRRRIRNWAIGIIGPWLLRAWVGSLRLRWNGVGVIRPSPEGRENAIYVFWHQRLLPFAVTHRGLGVRALISAHGDGEMLARVAEGLGHKAIRGSSTRGGVKAMRALLDETKSGRDFVVTPDGPQGPRHVLQIGTAYFASRSGLVVIPASASYAKSWSLPTWDGFLIPHPFTRALILAGTPMEVPADLEGDALEEWRLLLEQELRRVTEDGDRRFEEHYEKGLTTAEFRRLSPPFPWRVARASSAGAAGPPPSPTSFPA
jgi:lysophospholipid acyltransferase (LPLAT)-like uncharacterized protein